MFRLMTCPRLSFSFTKVASIVLTTLLTTTIWITSAGAEVYGGSCWNASVEALYMDRGTAASYGLLYDENSGDEVLNTSDLGFDFEVGPRVRLERAIGCGQSVELSYFGLTDWSSSAEAGPGDYLLIGDASRSGPEVVTANLNYDSALYSLECNLRGTPRSWFQPLIGFRWIRLEENYNVNGIADFGAPVDYVLNYDTDSNLFGGQIGGTALLWNRGALTISGIGKAGLYACDANNTGSFDGDFIHFIGVGSTKKAAFAGELGITATYQISCRWNLIAGYQALWLDGVALAPNQIAVTDIAEQSGGITTDGYLLFHGATIGLEAKW